MESLPLLGTVLRVRQRQNLDALACRSRGCARRLRQPYVVSFVGVTVLKRTMKRACCPPKMRDAIRPTLLRTPPAAGAAPDGMPCRAVGQARVHAITSARRFSMMSKSNHGC